MLKNGLRLPGGLDLGVGSVSPPLISPRQEGEDPSDDARHSKDGSSHGRSYIEVTRHNRILNMRIGLDKIDNGSLEISDEASRKVQNRERLPADLVKNAVPVDR